MPSATSDGAHPRPFAATNARRFADVSRLFSDVREYAALRISRARLTRNHCTQLHYF
jgi:hypothetical protein